MGDDFCSLHLRAPEKDPEQTRENLLRIIRDLYPEEHFEELLMEDDAQYDIAFSVLPGWSPIYASQSEEAPPSDTIGYSIFWDNEEMDRMACALSALGPVVKIHSDDSSALHLHLFRNGRHVDQVGNRRDVMTRWTDEQAVIYSGNPDEWREFIVSPHTAEEFLSLLTNPLEFGLYKAVPMIGGDKNLFDAGYFTFYDGVPTPLDEHLEEQIQEGLAFQQLHFRKRG